MFQTGQKVVCVDDKFDAWVFDMYKQLPKKDSVYTIRMCGMGAARPNFNVSADGVFRGDNEPDFNVLLDELINPNDATCQFEQELSFRADRFAPTLTQEVKQERREAVLV